MRRLEGGEDVAPRAVFMNRPMDAPLKTAEIGGNPRSVGGAPGGAGPYVTGAAHPGWRAPLGTPELRGQAPSQRVCQGSLANSQGASQTPGASRRSITPLRRGEEKRGWAYPAPENKEYGQR